MREIVHIQAGQCGNQIGAKVGCKCYHFIEDWGYLYALFSRDFFYIDRFRHSNYFIHYFWHLLDRNRLTLYLKFDRLLVYILCKVRFSRTGLWECPPPTHTHTSLLRVIFSPSRCAITENKPDAHALTGFHTMCCG